MKLIVGLGNPGEEYAKNRHNVGHMVIGSLLKRNLPKGITVKKTNIFMNESGQEVKKILGGSDPGDLYIIHDDLDIPLGSYKIQRGKGPKLHNGINSIERELGTDEFFRVRVGVENRDQEKRTPGEEYVLQDFSEEEILLLEPVIEEICKKLATS